MAERRATAAPRRPATPAAGGASLAQMATFVVLGAGMMGSALCVPLVDRGHRVRLVGTHLDGEIIAAMKLLAETEGIFTETAGGVTLGATIKLLEECRICRDESIVVCVPCPGLKPMRPLIPVLPQPRGISPRLSAFAATATTASHGKR